MIVPSEFSVRRWSAWPLRLQIPTWVPAVVVESGTSGHVSAPTGRSSPVTLVPPPPLVPPATRYITMQPVSERSVFLIAATVVGVRAPERNR
ncbi:hypothetical protein [Streptomyces sp. RTd22]|uniref:hypothetical protein n=1 Tax=Streptomyces sp. RTd22 TaxID=1841249 RepID=UPI0007C5D3DA|nr:hypothetical protein [Streptomyces sp. RTd22]